MRMAGLSGPASSSSSSPYACTISPPWKNPGKKCGTHRQETAGNVPPIQELGSFKPCKQRQHEEEWRPRNPRPERGRSGTSSAQMRQRSGEEEETTEKTTLLVPAVAENGAAGGGIGRRRSSSSSGDWQGDGAPCEQTAGERSFGWRKKTTTTLFGGSWGDREGDRLEPVNASETAPPVGRPI